MPCEGKLILLCESFLLHPACFFFYAFFYFSSPASPLPQELHSVVELGFW